MFKFNNGLGALLCGDCRTIIRSGSDMSWEETEAMLGMRQLPPIFCDNCKP